jgi:hypothetical protein
LVAAEQRVHATLAKLLKKHKTDSLVAIVAPEPLASVICHALGQQEWGDLWQCAKCNARWQVIDPPQAVEAK